MVRRKTFLYRYRLLERLFVVNCFESSSHTWHFVTARTTRTQLHSDKLLGGWFGAELKYAGFDAIVVHGQASSPVYLEIRDGKAQLAAATDLWGLDARQTQLTLKSRMGQLSRIAAEMGMALNAPELFVAGDADFHRALAEMSRNPLLVVLLDSIRDLMQEVRRLVHRHPGLYQIVMPDHRRIMERVIAKDPEGARWAMWEHLEHARRIQEEVLVQQETTGMVGANDR